MKTVSLLCKLIQFWMIALSVTVHKALILLDFFNHPYRSLAFMWFYISFTWLNSRSGIQYDILHLSYKIRLYI